MMAKIVDIVDTGYTYQVTANIDDCIIEFCTTHPTEEEIKYHLQKQLEMLIRAREVHDKYLQNFTECIGKEYEVKLKTS